MAEHEYKQLTRLRQRNGFAVVSSSRTGLWLGMDHLLCVEAEGYTESYRRFYFRDIQAITQQKTTRGRTIAIVTGAMAALFGLLAVMMEGMEEKWVLGILAAICAIPFILNFLYGPTCRCQLRTAVQTEELHSVSRTRRARKVMNLLRPLIAQAQGQFTAGEIQAHFEKLNASPGDEPPIIGIHPTVQT